MEGGDAREKRRSSIILENRIGTRMVYGKRVGRGEGNHGKKMRRKK